MRKRNPKLFRVLVLCALLLVFALSAFLIWRATCPTTPLADLTVEGIDYGEFWAPFSFPEVTMSPEQLEEAVALLRAAPCVRGKRAPLTGTHHWFYLYLKDGTVICVIPHNFETRIIVDGKAYYTEGEPAGKLNQFMKSIESG